MAGKPDSAWLSFASWLAQQQRQHTTASEPASCDELSEGGAGNDGSTRDQASSDAVASCSTPSAPPRPAAAPRQLARAALARDCRTETRLVDTLAGRQEMSILLAAPGTPLHKSPLVTAKQASALVAALCEPLVSVQVGKLTRRLEAPTVLRPQGERGALSLWLLPNDDLSLVWQERKADAAGTAAAPSAAASSAVPAAQLVNCDVSVWEELARFPAGCQLASDEPLVIIHMLRGDASGRSFYIKPRGDVAGAHIAASPLGMQPPAGGGSAAELRADAQCSDAADGEGHRMYFWLAEHDLEAAVHTLGRLKSMLKRPPTLSKRSGISERQLVQLASWLHRADAAAVQQQALAGAPDAAAPPAPSLASSRPAAVPLAVPLSPAGRGEQAPLAATGTVSATAAAVYWDRRFDISCPCSISVGVSMRLCSTDASSAGEGSSAESGGNGGGAEALGTEAVARAKAVAEEAARRAVERAGKQRIEERICEALTRGLRQQRARSKADRQRRREALLREQRAADAQPLIRRAVEVAERCGGECAPPPSIAVVRQLAEIAAERSGHSRSSSNSSSSSTPKRQQGLEGGEGPTSGHLRAAAVSARAASHSAAAAHPGANGRVTIENLHGLLNAASIEAHGAEDRGGGNSAAHARSEEVTLADLPDLLRHKPHAD